jgi:hypothetical protein
MSAASMTRCSRGVRRAAVPGGPLELPKRSEEVYGATLPVQRFEAEARQLGAGSQLVSSVEPLNRKPHGSAAGGPEGSSVNRRCFPRTGELRRSR